MPAEPTKAQREVLRWLVENGATKGVRGGVLVSYYAERKARERIAELEAKGREITERDRKSAGYSTTGRKHAWRRTGGRVLGQMEKKGLLIYRRLSWGTPEYDLTPEAIEIGRAARAE